MTLLLLVALLTASTAAAQSPTGPPPTPPTAISTDEASLVTSAWAALAEGDLGLAAARATELQGAFPRSVHILPLIVEINLYNGPDAALAVYEGMLGRAQQPREDPSVLRRIALGVLNEAAAGDSQINRIKALRALADDGDGAAAERLLQAAQQGSIGDIVTLAATGHPQAAARVAEALSQPVPNKIALIEALTEGGSTAAIPAIAAMLDDPRPEHRAAAATALGKLGARDHIPRLQAMLKQPDQPPSVPLAAAGALLRLDDTSGLNRLRETLHSPVPAMQLAAARELEPSVDGDWLNTVRGLRKSEDPALQLDAAELLIPHDPAAARATLEQLARSDDPGVASLAAEKLASDLSSDLSELRLLLREPVGRIDAALRILELTR